MSCGIGVYRSLSDVTSSDYGEKRRPTDSAHVRIGGVQDTVGWGVGDWRFTSDLLSLF